MLEMSVQETLWLIYTINSVDGTKLSYNTSSTQHRSFMLKTYPLYSDYESFIAPHWRVEYLQGSDSKVALKPFSAEANDPSDLNDTHNFRPRKTGSSLSPQNWPNSWPFWSPSRMTTLSSGHWVWNTRKTNVMKWPAGAWRVHEHSLFGGYFPGNVGEVRYPRVKSGGIVFPWVHLAISTRRDIQASS